ncbi:Muscle-specific protein [Trichinella spiralis]|uniref:Muscle-specific protein n=1 Tax=Trichinella spiralis TaxID=6334 RepID=A0ABR3KQN7_TRISP
MLLRDVTNGQYAVNIQLVIRSVHLDMMDFFPPSKVRTSKHQVDTRSDQDERNFPIVEGKEIAEALACYICFLSYYPRILFSEEYMFQVLVMKVNVEE